MRRNISVVPLKLQPLGCRSAGENHPDPNAVTRPAYFLAGGSRAEIRYAIDMCFHLPHTL